MPKPACLVFMSIISMASPWVIADEFSSTSSEMTGAQTRQWLELQKSETAASVHPQVITGPAAAKIYQRYLDSFSHPIPEYFTEVEANPFSDSRQ